MARTAPEAQANGDIGCAARTLCWCAFRRSAPLGSSRGNFGMALLLEWLWQSSDAKKRRETASSLRAERSNPDSAGIQRGPWIASSLALLAMTQA